MPKQILFKKEAREKLMKGVNVCAEAVTSTLGYNGKNVIVNKMHTRPYLTKDGVSVAREIILSDSIENTGSLFMLEIAAKTVSDTGDGTTTSILLAQKILEEGFKYLDKNVNAGELKKGIDKAIEVVCEEIKKMSIPIEQQSEKLKYVAAISANNDMELGQLIADAYSKIGKDGVVDVQESHSDETKIEVVKGLQFNKGYISNYFINNSAKLTCEIDNPYILIYDKTISTLKDDFLPLMEKVAKSGRSLFVIAEDVTGEALHALLANHSKAFQRQGGMFSCAVKAPYFGDLRNDILGDIAAMTSAQIISGDKGSRLSRVELNQLGEAEKIIITRDNTVIVNGKTTDEKIQERKDNIKVRLSNLGNNSEYDKLKQEERLAKLSGGIAVIYAGGSSDSDLRQKKDRIDDATRATKCALQEGIVAGGGTTYIRCIEALSTIDCENSISQHYGVQIVENALKAPLIKMAENGGYDGHELLNKVLNSKGNFGYNAKENTIEDLINAGIIDAAKVVIMALQNAASVAGHLINSNTIMVDVVEK